MPAGSAQQAARATVGEPAKHSAEAAAKDEPSPARQAAPTMVGEPMAKGIMELLREEIVSGIAGAASPIDFARFQSYADRQAELVVRALHGIGTGGELPPALVRPPDAHMLDAPAEAERIYAANCTSRPCDSHDGLARCWPSPPRRWTPAAEAAALAAPQSPQEALDMVRQAMVEAQVAYCGGAGPADEVGNRRAADVPGPRAVHAEPGGTHAGRPRHRPPAVRPDGEDGSRSPAPRRRGDGPVDRPAAVGPTRALPYNGDLRVRA